MATVTIEGRVVEHVEERYSGSVSAAVDKCRKENSGVDIEYINGRAVVGWCEVCRCPLYETSKYFLDSEGIMWCKKHGA